MSLNIVNKCFFAICLLFLLGTTRVYAKTIVNVRDFGVLANGTDETKLIQKAINHSTEIKGTLFLPKGTYLITEINITSDLLGETGTIIKKIVRGVKETYDFCNIRNQQNLEIKSIIFDGNVNSNITQGSIPLFIINSKYIGIVNCKFMNSPMAGLRVENSKNILISSCRSENLKGDFGDGYYFTNSTNIQVSNSSANNYSRIGFVVENKSSEFEFMDCIATNGTNASKLRGGTEYNAGFWYENSENIKTINCISKNNSHTGFVATNGSKLNQKNSNKQSIFLFKNCISEDNPVGFQLSSRIKEVKIDVLNCTAKNVIRGFTATARQLNDVFTFQKCIVYMNKIGDNNSNNIGFMWGSAFSDKNKNYKNLPIFNFIDSEVHYYAGENKTHIVSLKNNNGDLSTFDGGEAIINVNNLTNNLDIQTIIKARRGKPKYKIINTKVYFKD